MKILSIPFLAATALLLFAGCINDDLSDCPPPHSEMRLTFSYLGDTQDPAMFSRKIDGVNLYVFDRTGGELVMQKTVAKADLDRFQGTELVLPDGDYRIVCWGNAFSDTEILCSSLAGGCVHAPAYGAGQRIPTNDHLYHGDYDIRVPATYAASGNATGDIPFRSAHIDMEIYIKGFGHSTDTQTWPAIELGGLMPQYDMRMGSSQPFTTAYHPAVTWNADREVLASVFQVLRFADDNAVTVTVRGPAPDNEVKASISLSDYMIDNDISVDGIHEAVVRMLIEFTDLGVTISVPDWSAGDIEPEI